MSLTAKILALLAIIVAVVAGIWWVGIRDSGEPVPPVTQTVETAPPPKSEASPPVFTQSTARPRTNEPVAAPAVTNAVINDWEDRVYDILADDSEVQEKAKKMLELFPNFPAAGQIETAQHISNLLADEDYEKFGKYLTNTNAPTAVQDIVLADVLNRPNEIKLPLLLEAARQPQNPKSAEAREMLGLYLDEDYGNDWNKWENGVKQYLKDNPE